MGRSRRSVERDASLGGRAATDDRSRFGAGGRDEVAHLLDSLPEPDPSPWWIVHRLGRGLSGLCTGFGVITGAALVGSFGGAALGVTMGGLLLVTVWLTPALGRRLDAGARNG